MSPPTTLPRASFAVTRKRCTSPWRASARPGESSSVATGAATTSTGTVTLARPEVPVSVALPARTPATMPSWSTRATLGADDVQAMRSAARRSFVLENTWPPRRKRWPRASFTLACDGVMEAAEPGIILTSKRSTLGRAPETMATATTGSVPVAPDSTRPSESTVPSKRPPCAWKRMRTPSIALPAASNACAVRRNVSPASIVG